MAHAVYSPLPVFRIDKILLSTCWFLCVWKEKNISPKQIKGKTNCSLGIILTNFSLCMLVAISSSSFLSVGKASNKSSQPYLGVYQFFNPMS